MLMGLPVLSQSLPDGNSGALTLPRKERVATLDPLSVSARPLYTRALRTVRGQNAYVGAPGEAGGGSRFTGRLTNSKDTVATPMNMMASVNGKS